MLIPETRPTEPNEPIFPSPVPADGPGGALMFMSESVSISAPIASCIARMRLWEMTTPPFAE
jgi:hypothetical protein